MKYEIISKRIQEAMNDKKLNAAELSQRSGIGKSAISHYVNGRYRPDTHHALALSKVLEVNPIWLQGYNAEKFAEVCCLPSELAGWSNEPMHQSSLNLSSDEIFLIQKYRKSDNITQEMIKRILNFPMTKLE